MQTTHITLKDFQHLWKALKTSANTRNIPFSLSPTDIEDIGIPLTCPILNIPLVFNRGQANDNSISFDRIDSSKGYEKDNLIIISYRANRLKSDATLEELNKIVTFYNSLNML